MERIQSTENLQKPEGWVSVDNWGQILPFRNNFGMGEFRKLGTGLAPKKIGMPIGWHIERVIVMLRCVFNITPEIVGLEKFKYYLKVSLIDRFSK